MIEEFVISERKYKTEIPDFGYTFKKPELFWQAVTHKSWLRDQNDVESKDYQILENLGDSVLKIIHMTIIDKTYPDWNEGQRTEYIQKFEANENLSQWCRQLKLDEY